MLDCRKPEKVVLSDESHFLFQRNITRFIRIGNREQLNPAHCNELAKNPKSCFGEVSVFQ